jgi:hypothetical protein
MDEFFTLLSRKPYYALVSGYSGTTALWAFIHNSIVTGALAFVLLVFAGIAAAVSVWSAWYLINDERDTEVNGVTVSRKGFYALLGIVIVISGYQGLHWNLTSTGIISILSGAWFFLSLAIGFLSWKNWKTLVLPDITDAIHTAQGIRPWDRPQ